MTPLLREIATRCKRLCEMRDRLCQMYLETPAGTEEQYDLWSKFNAAANDCIRANEELAMACAASMLPAEDEDLEGPLEMSIRAVQSRGAR